MVEKGQDARQWVNTMKALRHSPAAQHYRRHEHGRRVAELAEAVATVMRLPQAEVDAIRHAALLHDIGNVGIPEEILLKPGPLTAAEYSRIQEHVHRGIHDLEAIEALQDAIPIVRHHHEWVNGSGYPAGLRGKAIPLGARVVAAAEAYVMMTAEVPWHAAKSRDEALRELCAAAGTHLDAEVVDHLVTYLRQRRNPHYSSE